MRQLLFTLFACLTFSTGCFAQSAVNFANEVTCLADNIYFEARGEGQHGWSAVASVTINRVNHSKYPDSVCKVVKQKRNNVCQFSWVCDRQLNNSDKSFRKTKLYRLIRWHAMNHYIGNFEDTTNGAIFYHSKKIKLANLGLNKKVKLTKTIGNHVFYR